MEKITAIIPTFNEEIHIEEAINSVDFAEEIIIIDSFSTDSTIEIAKKFEVNIIQRRFDDFSTQKNFAISKATNDWIFLLDADEIVSKNLKKEIISSANNSNNIIGFYIYRIFHFKNIKLKFSGWKRDKVIRLFHKKYCTYVGKVHEKIHFDGHVGFLENKIQHYSYQNNIQYKKKLILYAKLQALELFEKDKKINIYHFVLKPFIRFFIHFIIKLGFLDGLQGFKISYLHAFGVYKRYTELRKLRRNNYQLKRKNEKKELLRIGYDAKRIYHNNTGLGNYGRDLVNILSTFFTDKKMFLYNPKDKKINRLPKNLNLIEKLPNAKIWKFFSSFWRQKPIIKQLVKDRIQIFHGLSGEIPLGIEKTKIKSIVTVHDLIFIRYPKLYSFIDQRIHLRKVKNSVRNADKIIAISEQTKQDIIEFIAVDENKIEVIYQGCHSVFKEEKTAVYRTEVLKKYNLPEEFILNVGTINERKNLLSLVKAIKNIDTHLIVVGSKTAYFKKVESFIRSNKLEHKISIVSGLAIDELAALYQQAKLFVYPSIFEGFGIPIIEALYSKTPVISSTGSCFSEAGGPNSIYVKPYDIETLAAKINLVLGDEKLRKQMIEFGFKYVQKFNDEYIAQNFMQVYTNLHSLNK